MARKSNKTTTKVTKKKHTKTKRNIQKIWQKKTKFEVFVPRLKNKAFPERFKLNLTTDQIKFFDEHIFTNDNVSIFNEYSKCSNHREEKEKFIHKLASTAIGRNVVVKHYNEEDEKFEVLSFKEIVKYIFTKFVKKKSTLVNHVRKNDSLQDEINKLSAIGRLRYMPKYRDLHPHEEIPYEFSSPRWNLYSMIHNLYESFNLVIYSGSHYIDDYKETHRASRVVLKFPDNVNFFILFHGNLVHSGAAAKYEPYPNSMHVAADLRAFAYVNKAKNTKRAARNNNNTRPRDTHDDNAAVGTTCKACPKILDRGAKCEVCEKFRNKNIKSKLQNHNGFEIDILSVYNQKKRRNSGKQLDTDEAIPIVGNLEIDGWSVYEGIDTRDINEVGTLFQDCRSLVNEFANNFVNLQQNATQKSGRMRLTLGEHMLNKTSKVKEHLMSTDNFYKIVVEKKVKKVKGFEDCEFKERTLLYNKGFLNEQNIHKDYEPN